MNPKDATNGTQPLPLIADDPNASHYDSIELRTIHHDERATTNRRSNHTVMVAAILIPVLIVVAVFAAYMLGNHAEATYAAETHQTPHP